MKRSATIVALAFMNLLPWQGVTQNTFPVGTSVLDSCNFAMYPYRVRRESLIVPVMLNDSVQVHLLLDPHCKSIILFGKKYYRLIKKKRKQSLPEGDITANKNVVLHNKVSVGPAALHNTPIVVLNNVNPFNFFTDVNGVMGYDVFKDYEVILNRKDQIMTIRPIAWEQQAYGKITAPQKAGQDIEN